jgi:hypothetical protein
VRGAFDAPELMPIIQAFHENANYRLTQADATLLKAHLPVGAPLIVTRTEQYVITPFDDWQSRSKLLFNVNDYVIPEDANVVSVVFAIGE